MIDQPIIILFSSLRASKMLYLLLMLTTIWLIMKRYQKNLQTAHKISKQGINCFVDGGILTPEAIITFEKPEFQEPIKKKEFKAKLKKFLFP